MAYYEIALLVSPLLQLTVHLIDMELGPTDVTVTSCTGGTLSETKKGSVT